jgi:hypothetical protein
LFSSFPDNNVLTHLKASIHPNDDFLSIHEMMEEHGLTAEQVTDESSVPKVTIFKSLDSSYEIMHILTGHLVVHMVGEKSAEHSNFLRNNAVIMVLDYPSLLVIFTTRLMEDLSFIPHHHLSATLPIRNIAAPRGGCWCTSQLTTPEQDRRTKEGDVCT